MQDSLSLGSMANDRRLSENTALIRPKRVKRKIVLLLSAAASVLLMFQVHLHSAKENVVLATMNGAHEKNPHHKVEPKSFHDSAGATPSEIKSMIDSFRATMANEFKEFNEKLTKEVRMINEKHGQALNQNSRPHPASRPAKLTLPAQRVSAVLHKVHHAPPHIKTQNLKAETNELIALNAALQHQMLLSCVAQDRAKATGAALSQRQLQSVKRVCLARIAGSVAQELSARAPRKNNRTKYVWEPRHYRPIGYVHPERNYTSFIRYNAIRHALPVRANPFDDRPYVDPSAARLRTAGVRVDADFDFQRRSWGADGKDHYNFSARSATPFRYAAAQHPYWAFNNHALKSQPAFRDPEGPANTRLMLGTLIPSISTDNWVNKSEKEVPHESAMDTDHFGNWSRASPANHHLLYGSSSLFNGELPRRGRPLKPGLSDLLTRHQSKSGCGGGAATAAHPPPPAPAAAGPPAAGADAGGDGANATDPEAAAPAEGEAAPADGEAAPAAEGEAAAGAKAADGKKDEKKKADGKEGGGDALATIKDPWSLFDHQLNVSAHLDQLMHDVGIPVRDDLSDLCPNGVNCCKPDSLIDPGTVLGEATGSRLQTEDPELLVSALVRPPGNETFASPGRLALEAAGINVEGLQIG